MTNYKAIVFDPDTCLAHGLKQLSVSNITMCPATSAEQFYSSINEQPADLVMLDLVLPHGLNGLELVNELRKQRPDMPAILLTSKAPTEQDWLLAAAKPLVELMQTPITPGKLRYHLSRLFQPKTPAQHQIFVQPVEELRNDKGRRDAIKVSNVFDLTMSDLAACIGSTRQALTKTPDSMAIQTALLNFERIARSLITVTGSIKGLKMWLHSPNERFEGHTPLEIIQLGKVALLADWVDDARLGSPD